MLRCRFRPPQCEVEGDVLVSKVAGNVHVALGRSTVRQGRHIHEFNSQPTLPFPTYFKFFHEHGFFSRSPQSPRKCRRSEPDLWNPIFDLGDVLNPDQKRSGC